MNCDLVGLRLVKIVAEATGLLVRVGSTRTREGAPSPPPPAPPWPSPSPSRQPARQAWGTLPRRQPGPCRQDTASTARVFHSGQQRASVDFHEWLLRWFRGGVRGKWLQSSPHMPCGGKRHAACARYYSMDSQVVSHLATPGNPRRLSPDPKWPCRRVDHRAS